MSQQELLRRVVAALGELNIPYMLTGSVVSSLQGEPRSTHDIDIVVMIDKSLVAQLSGKFHAPQFHLDTDSIAPAIETQGMFNLLHVDEGDKVDFWILTDDAFDQSRFSRRVAETIIGMQVYVSRPEDTILMKLRGAKLSGGSEKQFTDALRVYEVQHEIVDMKYVEHWVNQLQLDDLWARLRNNAELAN